MSSHHVVRDAQEPALFILQPEYLSEPGLAPLLEWSPTIITLAEALPQLIAYQLKVDFVVIHADELPAIAPLLESQAPLMPVLFQEPDTPLSGALHHLQQEGHSAVNLLTTPAGPDQSLLDELARQEFIGNVVILNGEEKYALCRSGSFTKWLPVGESLSIRPIKKLSSLTATGFTENLHDTPVSEHLLLTTEAAGSVHIAGSSPFWVVEKLA